MQFESICFDGTQVPKFTSLAVVEERICLVDSFIQCGQCETSINVTSPNSTQPNYVHRLYIIIRLFDSFNVRLIEKFHELAGG